jgi:hypothetical protein
LEGEVEGVLTGVNLSAVPPFLVMAPTGGPPLNLTIAREARILVNAREGSLGDLVPGTSVKVRLDPATNEAIHVELASLGPNEQFAAGVVEELNRKLGRIGVLTTEGQRVDLSVDASTVIEREGKRVPIAAVKLGDLVRPTTHYNSVSLLAGKLALKEPVPAQLEGFARGKLMSSPDLGLLTITTPTLEVVTLSVSSATTLTREGLSARFGDIKVGERVVATYNSVDGESLRIEVFAPRAQRVSGVIVARNEETSVIAVETGTGERIALIISKKTRVTAAQGQPGTFADLKVGVRVERAFYFPETKEVASITISPP